MSEETRHYRCSRCGVGIKGDPLPPPHWRQVGADPEEYLCQECAQAWEAGRLEEEEKHAGGK